MDTEGSAKKHINAADALTWTAIQEIYNEVSQESTFPKGSCYKTVMRLIELGCGYQVGQFQLDFSSSDGMLSEIEEHTWAIDSNGSIIELTGEQFNQGLLLEHQFHGPTIITPDNPLYKRYQPLNRRARHRQ